MSSLKIKDMEQAQSTESVERVTQDKIVEIYNRFSVYKTQDFQKNEPDFFCKRVLKRASVLFVEDSIKKIDKASESIYALKTYLEKIPGYDFGQFETAFAEAQKRFMELQAQCNTLKQKFGQIADDALATKACVDYICAELKNATECCSEFGIKLAECIAKDEVIECYNGAGAWYDKILDVIDVYEKTENIFDDGLINICDVLKNYIKQFRIMLKDEVDDNFKNSLSRLYYVSDDATEKYASIVKIAGFVIHIGNKLLNAIDKVLQLSDCISLYMRADDVAEYKELKKAEKQFKDRVINISMYFVEEFEDKEISFKHDSEINIQNIADKLEKEKSELDKIGKTIDIKLDLCKKIMVTEIEKDRALINKGLARVKPMVSEWISELGRFIYYPDAKFSSRFVNANKDKLNGVGVTTLTLSSLFEACKRENIMILVERKINRVFSLAALKALGMISADANVVFIVDDGYASYPNNIQWGSCFSEEDRGKLFFSESAAKRFKSIVRG